MYFYFSHTCYTPYPSPWLDNPNHIWWRPNIVRLHTRGFLLRLSVSVKVVYFEYICIYICLFIYLFIYLYVILALTLVAPSYSTRTTPSPTVSLFCPSHGSSRFLRNVGTYLPSCTVSHLRRLAVFHLSWLSDRRDRRWWWGGGAGRSAGWAFRFDLLGCDTAFCGRHCGTICCFEVVFRKGGKERKKTRSVHTWRRLVT